MDRRDRIVVFAGVAILVIALIGVILSGEETSDAEKTAELKTFNINWQEKTVDVQETGTVMKGSTQTYNFSIDKQGLLRVNFMLDWTDDRARGFIIPWNWSDTLEMSVSAPGNVQFSGSNSVSGTSSPLDVEAPISTMPSSIQVNASNISAVYDMIEEEYMHSTGVGVWKATVGISTKPFLLDRGNDINILVRYSYFEPIITEVTSS